MFEQVNIFLSKVHVNMLFLLGLALFGGTAGGRIFQKLKIPQVVGYIAIGLIIGKSGLKIINQATIDLLQPFNYFALGLIGFMVGGELRKDIFSRYGKQLITILLFEGIGPFILVSVTVGFLGSLFFDWKLAWALGLLMGAIASATDPASTTEVLREYKTKGPLTTTLIGIVALDDGLALMLFALASTLAGSLTGNAQEGLLRTFIHPLYDIGGAVILGILAGITLCLIFKKYIEESRLLAFTVGSVLITVGLSLVMNVELIMATMVAGVIITNYVPRKSEEVFKLVSGFTPPIYVLFFVLVGAQLSFSQMNGTILFLVLMYLFGTLFGKAFGAFLGAKISGAPRSLQKYLPIGLFSQAGIAIGLSILAAHYFSGRVGNTLVVVITATTFITQVIGPYLTKVAASKAGEVGLDITEDELMQKMKVSDVMDRKPPLIKDNSSLDEIISVFSQTDNLYYPVITSEKKLSGIISVDGIKNIIRNEDLQGLVLASDLKEPVLATIFDTAMLSDAQKIMDRHKLDYLPVVTQDNKIAGFIDKRSLGRIVSTKIMELQKRIELSF